MIYDMYSMYVEMRNKTRLYLAEAVHIITLIQEILNYI